MIGLIFFGIMIIWFLIAIKITLSLISNIKDKHKKIVLGVIISPIIFFLPIFDEYIGSQQFEKLCKNEEAWLSPNHKNVTAIIRLEKETVSLVGYLFPIRVQIVHYVDAFTNEDFYRYKAFHTPRGFLMRNGLNLGNSSSCAPDNRYTIKQGIDFDLLLENGKSKVK